MIAVAQVSPARQAAFRTLLAVERGPSHCDDLLRGKAVSALAPADRNLATALVLGVLRWQIWLDGQTRPLLKRPNAKLDREILIALRLGAFQLLLLDRIPAHAAIGESVELAKQAGQRFAAGMVNAVLRKLAALNRAQTHEASGGDEDIDASRSAPGRGIVRGGSADRSTPAVAAAQEINPAAAYPAWMLERWERFYGVDAAHAICRYGQAQPRLTVRIESPLVETELAQAGIRFLPGELLWAARTVAAGDVAATAAFRDGRVRIQDEGSQLVGEMAAACLADPGRKLKSIVDACAAPGGKTLILAQRHPEAQIVACEASPSRFHALRERLRDGAGKIECRLADAAALDQDSAFDLALADVPCSGTGTLGRNPEIRHRLRAEDLARQAERQVAILRAALRAVRPGGRVVYSTCSLEPEENEQVVAAVLAGNAKVRQVSVQACIDRMRSGGILATGGAERLRACVTAEGALRLLPGAFGTDGFFVAAMERMA